MGIPTDLIDTPLFVRMVPRTPLDYGFLVANSLLLGAYASLSYHGRGRARTGREDYAAMGGTLGGVLAFGCPVCNQLLILLIGVAGALTYIDPYRPLLGVASSGLIGLAVSSKVRQIQSCRLCGGEVEER
jgi:hypothetical protein